MNQKYRSKPLLERIWKRVGKVRKVVGNLWKSIGIRLEKSVL